jgi:hypothetical protein
MWAGVDEPVGSAQSSPRQLVRMGPCVSNMLRINNNIQKEKKRKHIHTYTHTHTTHPYTHSCTQTLKPTRTHTKNHTHTHSDALKQTDRHTYTRLTNFSY